MNEQKVGLSDYFIAICGLGAALLGVLYIGTFLSAVRTPSDLLVVLVFIAIMAGVSIYQYRP